jgi:AcrR family transcriptional regulator
MVLRVKPEKKEEKDRIRADLQRAALRLGAAHGFASLGLREVAREAQIAPTSFYRHFEGMEALGLSVVRDMVMPLLREWVAALDPARADPAALVDALCRLVDDDPELTRFLVAERVGSSRALREALRNALSVLGQPLVSVFAMEAAADLLDSAPEGRPALRQRTVQRLASAVAAAHDAGPNP